jgi:hypothetical protein
VLALSGVLARAPRGPKLKIILCVRALIAFVFNLSNLRDFQLRKTRGC